MTLIQSYISFKNKWSSHYVSYQNGCGNGIGSSLMAANNVKKICDELGIKADVASVDFANAVGEKADLYVTIKELANQFPAHCHVAIIRSYVHKAKIAEDITDALMKIAATHS